MYNILLSLDVPLLEVIINRIFSSFEELFTIEEDGLSKILVVGWLKKDNGYV
jgi:hypothetical protein